MRERPSQMLMLTLLLIAFVMTPSCKDDADGAGEVASAPACSNCGEIASIQPREVQGKASPAAAVAGAIIGGVIGHQFGSGSGNDAATAAGAVGGAVAGKEIDERRKTHLVYDVTIDMDGGGTRQLTLASREGLSAGERVRVLGDRVEPI